MRVTLAKEFHFEASHRLMQLPDSHPCYRMHGHSYRVIIEVTGDVDESTGFLIDYGDLKQTVQPIIDQLDHRHLNDVEGMRQTSAEDISRWLWQRLKPGLPILCKIVIHETASTRCEYWGE
jgi:6-pyruvoyltetrahydropterin/6-carboxytetrahydropterin synthase